MLLFCVLTAYSTCLSKGTTSWISIHIHSDLQPVYVSQSTDTIENEIMQQLLSVQRPVQKKEDILRPETKISKV